MIEVAIRVLDLDLEDPTVLETLEASMGVGMVEPHDEYAVVPFFVNEESAQAEVAAFVRRFRAALPHAEVEGLDSDLVNHTEIAGRVGVSREAARLWAKEAAFPIPVSSVGPKGEKVYEWADVAHWLGATGRDPEAPGGLPTSAQRVRLAAAVLGASTESLVVQSTLDSRAAQGDSTSAVISST